MGITRARGIALRRRFGPWRHAYLSGATATTVTISDIAKVPAGRHGKKVGARVATNHAAQPEEDLVRLYLNDIGKHPLLTKDDEARLATEVFVKADLRLVVSNRQEVPGVPAAAAGPGPRGQPRSDTCGREV